MENNEAKNLLELSEEEVLNILLGAGKQPPPQREGIIQRLGLPFILKGIPDQVEQIRNQCTFQKDGKDDIDSDLFDLSLIVAASVKPNWKDPKLIAEYQASGPEQVVKKVLYPGERTQLALIVVSLSGIGENAIQIVKN